MTFMCVVFTSPANKNPVEASTSGGRVPCTRCSADFQMIRGSSAPTSVQSAPEGSAAGDCSDFRAVGKSSPEQAALEHDDSAATWDDWSIFFKSTSSTRPAASTTTAV